uniref:Secreted protein n=1 Tax=Anguilla anguilla TaxID=7936 RepID=A0A0E9WNL7_ANGAN
MLIICLVIVLAVSVLVLYGAVQGCIRTRGLSDPTVSHSSAASKNVCIYFTFFFVNKQSLVKMHVTSF